MDGTLISASSVQHYRCKTQYALLLYTSTTVIIKSDKSCSSIKGESWMCKALSWWQLGPSYTFFRYPVTSWAIFEVHTLCRHNRMWQTTPVRQNFLRGKKCPNFLFFANFRSWTSLMSSFTVSLKINFIGESTLLLSKPPMIPFNTCTLYWLGTAVQFKFSIIWLFGAFFSFQITQRILYCFKCVFCHLYCRREKEDKDLASSIHSGTSCDTVALSCRPRLAGCPAPASSWMSCSSNTSIPARYIQIEVHVTPHHLCKLFPSNDQLHCLHLCCQPFIRTHYPVCPGAKRWGPVSTGCHPNTWTCY